MNVARLHIFGCIQIGTNIYHRILSFWIVWELLLKTDSTGLNLSKAFFSEKYNLASSCQLLISHTHCFNAKLFFNNTTIQLGHKVWIWYISCMYLRYSLYIMPYNTIIRNKAPTTATIQYGKDSPKNENACTKVTTSLLVSVCFFTL